MLHSTRGVVRCAAFAAALIAILPSLARALPVYDDLDASPYLVSRDVNATLKQCLSDTGATLIYPGDQQYANLSAAENTNYNTTPNVLAQPTSAQQVSSIIKCVAAQNGQTKISPRSGGHSYAAYCLDANVVLDSSKMQDIDIDTDAKTVRAGFGQTLGPLAVAMADKGFALPHGTCPQVGIGGHSLGGGWGYSSRKWGWLVDHIVAMEIVDATGAIRNITANSTGADADLWWALRGAGSNNFGVVTHFTFAMEQAPAETINYSHVYDSNDDCVQVLLALQTLGSRKAGDAPYLPAELGGELLLYGVNSGNPGACSFNGQFLGPKNDYKAAMKNLNDELAKVNVTASKVTSQEFDSWKAALTNLMGNLYAPQDYVAYYAQSVADDGAPGYTEQSGKSIMEAVQNAVLAGGAANSISFDLNGPESATNIVPAPNGNMSFILRTSLFFSQIYSYDYPSFSNVQEQQTTLDKLDGINTAVQMAKKDGEWHAYSNYIDPNLKNFGQAYYGTSLDRLKSIKATADPTTIFDFPQGLAHA